jgi:hypothetical protein
MHKIGMDQSAGNKTIILMLRILMAGGQKIRASISLGLLKARKEIMEVRTIMIVVIEYIGNFN